VEGWIYTIQRGQYNNRLKVNMRFNILSFLPFLSKEINMYDFIEESKKRKGTNETSTTLVNSHTGVHGRRRHESDRYKWAWKYDC